MKYFGILGKTLNLSLAEMKLLAPTDVSHEDGIVYFQTQQEAQITQLGGLIKRGVICNEKELGIQIKEASINIVGVDSNELGLMIKRNYGVRRYKIIDQERSDLEIKKKGAEVFSLGDGTYGLVMGRQNIDLYSMIDFDKPAHGMQIGMMPSKLAQILVNIGVGVADSAETLTIYDPFCGFGTTNFIANHLGYHTIGSDINITPAKQNIKRRKTQSQYQEDKHMTFFKHDVNDEFTKPFLDKVDVVVTEGRLGPVVKQEMLKHKNQTHTILKDNLGDIVDIYTAFLTNFKNRLPLVPIVMTVPEYLRLDHPIISDRITEAAVETGYTITSAGEVYQRKGQQVGRRVLVLR